MSLLSSKMVQASILGISSLATHGELSQNICNIGQTFEAAMPRKPNRTLPRTSPATIRAFFLTPLVRELAKEGLEINGFLGEYGLSFKQLANLYERVPLRHYVAIAEDVSRRLDRPFLGLELGTSFSIADLGPFYAMLVLAPNLLEALSALARYQSAWQTDTMMEIVAGKDTSICRYLIHDPAIWPRRQDAEFALASVAMVIRQLTGQNWRPVAVEFEHDVAGRADTLQRFFRAPITGRGNANSLLLRNSDLAQSLRWKADPAQGNVLPILERHLKELLGDHTRLAQSHRARARAIIARRLGRTSVTIEGVATEMSTSVRSLRRHLAQEGCSFRQLLQEHRRTTVESILGAGGAPLSDLAARLSYSDGAVLSRAFKAWTGQSPGKYATSK